MRVAVEPAVAAVRSIAQMVWRVDMASFEPSIRRRQGRGIR